MVNGDSLRRLRRERGWSRKELGDRAGLSWQMIKSIELGRRQPGEDSGHGLADALYCELDAFSTEIAA